MSLPRRKFLKSGVLSALSAGAILGSARAGFSQKTNRVSTTLQVPSRAGIPIEAQRDPVFLFNHTTFEPYVGDLFQAPNARGEMVSLTLVRVNVYKPQTPARVGTGRAVETDGFTLTFRASDQLPPFTSIHRISHPALGRFDLFLTSTQSGDFTFYEAVINHIR